LKLSLVTLALGSGHVPNLLTAVTQLNLGGPKAVQDKQQYTTIARYNLIAGKKAMEMSEFSSAFNYFDNGITFLRKKHWQDEYELSLELYNLAAKCALAIKDTSSLTILCDAVSKNARAIDDRLETSFLTMTALAHTNIPNSVLFGLNMLSLLGVELPASSPSRENTVAELRQTQHMLNDITDETLLSYHVLTMMTMKLLAKMITCLNQCKPEFASLVTVKLVRLSIEHGLVSVFLGSQCYYCWVIS
jgi:predicted ATPase